jgi:diguanylate cyclase
LSANDPSMDLKVERRLQSLSSLWSFRVWLACFVSLTAVFALQSFYPNLIGPLSNVFPTACASGAFASALLCLRRYRFGLRSFQAIWFFFALGTGLWVLAEATWAIYYFVLNILVPYPSLADIFYIGGYLPIIAALGVYLGTFRVAMSRRRLGLAIVIIGIAVTLAMAFVLPIEFAKNLSLVNLMTDMIYPVLDLVLLSLAVLSLAIFYGGTIAKWWMLFGVGATLYVVGDEFFLYQVAGGTYYNGGLDDLIFLLGYLVFALAFYTHRKEF